MENDIKEVQERKQEHSLIIKGRGGYRDESDFLESQKRAQQVRGEFLSSTFKAKVTFAFDSITFNTACVGMFPTEQYIFLRVDKKGQRVIIEPCEGGDKDSLKFANHKSGKNIPRKCIARRACQMLYELMEWHTQARYQVLAIQQEFFGRKIVVFNLDESLQVFRESFEDEDGKQKRKTIINMPEDWKGRFGYTAEEIESRRKVEDDAEFILIDNKTGAQRRNFLEPILPTPEELIHRPYGGIRSKVEEEHNESEYESLFVEEENLLE